MPGLDTETPGITFSEVFQFDSSHTDYTLSTSTLEYTASTLGHKDLSTDNTNATMGFAGALSSTGLEWNTTDSVLQMSASGLTTKSATLESRIFRGSSARDWSEIKWESELPSGKAYPNSNGQETGFSDGNIDMSHNVLLMHFDESSWNGTPNEVLDSSGSANHGTAQSGATTATFSKFGRAALFTSSTNHYVTVPHNAQLDSSTQMSWEAWIYPTTVDTNPRAILSKRESSTATNNAYSIFLHTGKKMFIDIGGTSTGYRFDTGKVFAANAWYYVAVTYDGGLSTNRLKFYVNGGLVNQFTTTATSIPATDSNAPLCIGCLPGNTTASFLGTIDEVAIYDRALSDTEIQDRYERGIRKLKFQVRGCDMSDCSDGTFVGPDGTASTYFTEASNSTLTNVTSATLSGIHKQFFQYKAFFESEDSVVNPKLASLQVSPALFDSGYPTVINNSTFAFKKLSSFSDTAGGSGLIKYQISPDGANWYYWTAGTWQSTTLGYSQSNTATEINAHISTYPTSVSQGLFHFKAFFDSGTGSSDAAELTSITVTGER